MNKNQIVGRAIALTAAIFYGVNSTLSRLAYDTGTTPVSLTLYRFLMSAALMIALVLILRKSWKLKVNPLLFAFCVSGMFATAIGHLGAVNYIPVSLAAVIFYTFPLYVVAYQRIAHREPLARHELIAFVLAFVGIAIALGPDFHEFDPAGIALAFGGAIGATVFILSYEKFPPQTDSYVSAMWIMITSIAFALLLQLGFDLVPPRASIGWIYLVMIAAASVISFVLSLQAIRRVGSAIFSLLLNFEPIVILSLAWIVLGEELSPERISGIALIVFALFLSHWRVARGRPQPVVAPGD
ncbi:MAG: DMT family transporter [Gammaproteobacteria bacterium]|nr:DMT family transporter [Gammaproteobacteria bacterium]